MGYVVKEMFLTLQGEGAHTGRTAVFCRFAGCNLWSGHEKDRSTAVCQFCDTDFIGTDGDGGGRFRSSTELAEGILKVWEAVAVSGVPYVVFTGGEPLLQLDEALVSDCQQRGFEVAIETNGTIEAPASIDWVCVSPKAGAGLKQRSGNELKLVFPQVDFEPGQFEALDFEHFFLQPMDGPERSVNTAKATAYCMSHPKWRLSLQTHKLIGIP
jgi:7-carboxy-7-deazaguanine synthase